MVSLMYIHNIQCIFIYINYNIIMPSQSIKIIILEVKNLEPLISCNIPKVLTHWSVVHQYGEAGEVSTATKNFSVTVCVTF